MYIQNGSQRHTLTPRCTLKLFYQSTLKCQGMKFTPPYFDIDIDTGFKVRSNVT